MRLSKVQVNQQQHYAPECKTELKNVVSDLEAEVREMKQQRNEKRLCAYMGTEVENMECKEDLEKINAEIDEKEYKITRLKKMIDDWPDVDKEKLEHSLSDMEDAVKKLKQKRNEKRFCAYMDDDSKNVKCKEELEKINAEIKEREESICECRKKVKNLSDVECNRRKRAVQKADDKLADLKAKRNEKRLCAYMDDGPENLKCKEELRKINARIDEEEARIARRKQGFLFVRKSRMTAR